MSQELWILVFTACSIGFIHTLFGPDHYLPFIVMSKSGHWSMKKTVIVTFLCGIGHVLSSIILGIIGILFGIAILKLEFIESFRGEIAAWLLIAFGLLYCIWGIRRAYINKPHKHLHFHKNGSEHLHDHMHKNEHSHVHSGSKKTTPWILFIIFVFGPCEPLIPILMYPAAKSSYFGLIIVALTFAITTIATMLLVVLAGVYGIKTLPLKYIEKYTHAIAGFTIFLCGAAIQFLGL
jgi:nickel/cobalt transporter (NicO) family protein